MAKKALKQAVEEDFDDEPPAKVGHNQTGGIETKKLKAYVERIETLEEEKSEIAGSISEIYTEAKSSGFDPKIMRQVVRARKLRAEERAEQEYMYDLYARALGMSTDELDRSLD